MVVDKVIVEKDIGLLKTILLGMGAALVFVQAASLAQQYLLELCRGAHRRGDPRFPQPANACRCR